MKKSVHILRYGTAADSSLICEYVSRYDYLAINGSTAAYVSGAIARLVLSKFLNNPQKGYFIDPLTYAFQGDINLLKKKGKLKESVKKLVAEYCDPVESKILKGVAVVPMDFEDPDDRESFCHKVIDFQYNLVSRYIEEKGFDEYLSFMKDIGGLSDELRKSIVPKFVIAPYFYLDLEQNMTGWLRLNVEFAKIAKDYVAKEGLNIPVFAQIVISKNVLSSSDCMKKVASAYDKAGVDGFTIWVDDFDETKASPKMLQEFVEFLKELPDGKPVYNMYGSYFSVLLTHAEINLLDGVSHGIEYGESRSVYPVGGGIPTSKYYYMPLHMRMSFFSAFSMLADMGYIDTKSPDWGLSDKYFNDICRCNVCRELLSNGMLGFSKYESTEFYDVHVGEKIIRRSKSSSETKELCRKHYLECKQVEFNAVNRLSIRRIQETMMETRMLYKGKYDDESKHLERWGDVLGSYASVGRLV